MDKTLTKVIGYGVTAAWLTSFVADLFLKSYDPPAAIHAAMMLVVGAAFGHTVFKPGQEDRDK